MSWRDWVAGLYDRLRPGQTAAQTARGARRGPVDHVLILDGTMSTLTPGLRDQCGADLQAPERGGGAEMTVFYEAGIQWRDWRATGDIILGRGINHQIRRAYGYLASRYRPGDRIFLLGYSRGALRRARSPG